MIVASSIVPIPGLTRAAAAATLTVNSTRDVGDVSPGNGLCDTGTLNSQGATECTLRAAIEEANALAGVDTITVGIPTSESGFNLVPPKWTIFPSTDLTTTAPIILDATTQPSYAGMPRIVIDGTSNGGENLFTIQGGNSTVRGFTFHNNIGGSSTDSIEVESGDGNTIQGNLFGVEVDGVTAVGTGYGINIKTDFNLVGGPNPGEGNVFGALTNDAVYTYENASDNVYQGNYLGTDATGITQMGNGQAGFVFLGSASNNLVGGTNPGEGNVVANHTSDGIEIQPSAGSGNAFIGNEIYNNGGLGIDLRDDGVTPNDPGDSDSGPNDLLNFPDVITAIDTAGVLDVDFDVDLPSGTYRIEFFTNASGADASGNGEGETFESAVTIVHTGSGIESFSHSFAGSVGDVLTATSTQDLGGGAYGSTSEFNDAFAVTLSTTTVVVNSTDDDTDASPGDDLCETGQLNSAGVPECTLRAAIIEANASALIETISFDMPSTESGHFGGLWTITPGPSLPSITSTLSIDGTTQSGFVANTAVAPAAFNGTHVVELNGTSAGGPGLFLSGGSDGSAIRGLVINRFGADGILLFSSSATIVGNYIGTDATGLLDRGNDGDGIDIRSGSHTIGGTAPADRNLISGNNQFGISLDDNSADNIVIEGNLIGVNVTGNASLGNSDDGVRMQNGASGNTIGGLSASTTNVISANGGNAFEIGDAGTSNNVILGNHLGVGGDGVTPLGNGDPGLWIGSGASQNTVGGDAAGTGNIIAYNSGAGIRIPSSARHSILGNSIYTNTSIGIDLGTSGVTANDAGDVDLGANDLLNFPVVTTAAEVAGTVTWTPDWLSVSGRLVVECPPGVGHLGGCPVGEP